MDNMSLGRVFWNLRPKNSILTHLRYVSCWSCGINNSNLLSNLFCPHCKALQKPDNSENYFRILGVKETYDLDEVELAKKYKDLQKYLHPDKFGNRLVLIFFLFRFFRNQTIVHIQKQRFFNQPLCAKITAKP